MEDTLELSDAIAVGHIIEDALADYAANITQYGIKVLPEPGHSRSAAKMRASAFSSDKCPKRATAESKWPELFEFDEKDLWKFALAHYAAALAKVAIKRYIEELSRAKFSETGEEWTVRTEVPVEKGDMSGTVDALISFTSSGLETTSLPVEIKKTEVELSQYAVWQVIAYMWMLDAPYGYVLTLYNGTSGTYKAWLVEREKWGWVLYDGLAPARRVTLRDLMTAFVHEDFDQIYDSRIEWSGKSDGLTAREFLEIAPPIKNHLSMPCVRKVTPPDEYKQNSQYGKKGELKRGTGIASGICPLYEYCWRDRLAEANVTITDDKLEIEKSNDGFKLRSKKPGPTPQVSK